MRKRIVIVECYSSAVNYIHDIRELGFEPVLLEQYQPEEEREKVREMNDAAYAFNGDLRPMVIMAKESYEETLEMVRRLMPVLILPGSDPGTELALRLSFDLKLKNNPLGIFWNIRDKRAMQEALKSAGLRFIRSYTICSEEDALRRYRAGKAQGVLQNRRLKMEGSFDVVALGELLIDMTMNGKSARGNAMYEANPGGAPCNVLAMLCRLGRKTAFIGKVGDDMFGHELKEVLGEVGIDRRGLVMDPAVHTTLAFVKTFEDGDRDFSFYRNPGADMMLKKEDVDTELIRSARIFHFGTLSMTHEPSREATIYALDEARNAGCMISFDPNIREPLWDSMDDAKRQVLAGIGYCDVLKISDNEIQWLTGLDDHTEGVEWIFSRCNVRLVTVSLGKSGSMAFYRNDPSSSEYIRAEVSPFLQKDTIETTGAGDTFGGCVLNFVLEKGLDDLGESDLKEILTFANAAASIITTRRGALRVMPEPDEVRALMESDNGRSAAGH